MLFPNKNRIDKEIKMITEAGKAARYSNFFINQWGKMSNKSSLTDATSSMRYAWSFMPPPPPEFLRKFAGYS